MQSCPHCKIEIRIQELRHPGIFKDYRICPNCRGKFTTDKRTKHLQAVFLLILIASLVFTVLLYLRGSPWLLPAAASYAATGLIIYRGNKRMYFVPYGDSRDKTEA